MEKERARATNFRLTTSQWRWHGPNNCSYSTSTPGKPLSLGGRGSQVDLDLRVDRIVVGRSDRSQQTGQRVGRVAIEGIFELCMASDGEQFRPQA